MRKAPHHHHHVQITYLRILKNVQVIMALASAVVTLILTLFFDGILSNHLIDIGVNPKYVGKHQQSL